MVYKGPRKIRNPHISVLYIVMAMCVLYYCP